MLARIEMQGKIKKGVKNNTIKCRSQRGRDKTHLNFGMGILVGRLDDLAEVVGRDAAHVVMHGGQHRDWLLRHIHASKDRGSLRNA